MILCFLFAVSICSQFGLFPQRKTMTKVLLEDEMGAFPWKQQLRLVRTSEWATVLVYLYAEILSTGWDLHFHYIRVTIESLVFSLVAQTGVEYGNTALFKANKEGRQGLVGRSHEMLPQPAWPWDGTLWPHSRESPFGHGWAHVGYLNRWWKSKSVWHGLTRRGQKYLWTAHWSSRWTVPLVTVSCLTHSSFSYPCSTCVCKQQSH